MMTTVVLLKLSGLSSGKIYWENDRSSSSLYCRPLKLEHEKETKEAILEENENLEKEIGDLHDLQINNKNINNRMHLTMIDMKVHNNSHFFNVEVRVFVKI